MTILSLLRKLFTRPVPVPETHDTLVDKIREYRNLPNDWDTYGGDAPTETAVARAVALIEALQLRPEIPRPDVSAMDEGVALLWSNSGDWICDVEFEGDDAAFSTYSGNRLLQYTNLQPFDAEVTVRLIAEAIKPYNIGQWEVFNSCPTD